MMFIRCPAVITIVMALADLLSVHSAKAEAQIDLSGTFVGAKACAGCHAAETERWKTSHHALAMQKVTAATVLGDFANAMRTHHGVTTTFSRDGEKFMVRTEGPDGAPHDYDIAYTFGVFPLQQYLIAFPGGRYQALGIAWDSRPKEHGGQRWFPLYPDQFLRAGDGLHWTGRDQTWNYQCASCHSTDLKKNYNLAADSYATSWTDVDVACEARAPTTSPGPKPGRPKAPDHRGRSEIVSWRPAGWGSRQSSSPPTTTNGE